MYEKYLELLEEKNCRNIDVSKATGIPPSTFSDWKKENHHQNSTN